MYCLDVLEFRFEPNSTPKARVRVGPLHRYIILALSLVNVGFSTWVFLNTPLMCSTVRLGAKIIW